MNSIAFSADGRTPASGSSDHTIILWDVSIPAKAIQLGDPLTGQTDAVTSVAFSPDSQIPASASADKTILLWNINNLLAPTRLSDPITGHTGPVYSVVFSPNGQTLASASADTNIFLWMCRCQAGKSSTASALAATLPKWSGNGISGLTRIARLVSSGPTETAGDCHGPMGLDRLMAGRPVTVT